MGWHMENCCEYQDSIGSWVHGGEVEHGHVSDFYYWLWDVSHKGMPRGMNLQWRSYIDESEHIQRHIYLSELIAACDALPESTFWKCNVVGLIAYMLDIQWRAKDKKAENVRLLMEFS